MSDIEQINKIIEEFFKIGKTKNLSNLRNIQLNDSSFSSFSDLPPYDLKDYSTTLALEELRFVSISDYDYKIIDLKTNIFDEMAVTTFELIQKGMLVDNKAYTGQHMTMKSRCTVVLIRKPTWKIIHYHFSKIN